LLALAASKYISRPTEKRRENSPQELVLAGLLVLSNFKTKEVTFLRQQYECEGCVTARGSMCNYTYLQ
jgi:hypothetical protein